MQSQTTKSALKLGIIAASAGITARLFEKLVGKDAGNFSSGLAQIGGAILGALAGNALAKNLDDQETP